MTVRKRPSDSGRLFHRAGVQEQNALALASVWTLGANRVIPLWYLNEWDGSDVEVWTVDHLVVFLEVFHRLINRFGIYGKF